MVPVSIRSGDEEEKWTNRVSAIFATLPTDEPDPVLRVARAHEAMVDAKGLNKVRGQPFTIGEIVAGAKALLNGKAGMYEVAMTGESDSGIGGGG